MSEPITSIASILCSAVIEWTNSRSSGLTTVKTTRAPSRAARSRTGRAASFVRTRVWRRIMAPACGNWSSAARTTFSAVSPVESDSTSMKRGLSLLIKSRTVERIHAPAAAPLRLRGDPVVPGLS